MKKHSLLTVVKIGGEVVENIEVLNRFLKDFSAVGNPKILVHGGGKKATQVAQQFGIPTIMREGRRITSADMLDVSVMVYAGLFNKTIVGLLQKHKTNAIGLCGADAGCILAQKRSTKPIDYGFVGDVKHIHKEQVSTFLSNNLTPVFCAITCDSNGQLLNTNADTIATDIAVAMNSDYKVQLIYCLDKSGVLKNTEDDASVITRLSREDFEKMKGKGLIYAGMLPKLENAFRALSYGIDEVVISNTDFLRNQRQRHTRLTLK